MKGIKPAESNRLIESEKRRLQEIERNQQIKENHWCEFVMQHGSVKFQDFVDAMASATSFSDFVKRLKLPKEVADRILQTLMGNEAARRDFNAVRGLLDLKPLRLRKAEVGPTVRLTKNAQPVETPDQKPQVPPSPNS